MKAKDIAKMKLIKFLSDPEGDILPYTLLSTQVLGYKNENQIHKLFKPEELTEIFDEALKLRRKRYAYPLMKIDKNVLEQGEKNYKAAELAYKRFENWVPKTGTEHSLNKETLQVILECLPEDFRNKVIQRLEQMVATGKSNS